MLRVLELLADAPVSPTPTSLATAAASPKSLDRRAIAGLGGRRSRGDLVVPHGLVADLPQLVFLGQALNSTLLVGSFVLGRVAEG